MTSEVTAIVFARGKRHPCQMLRLARWGRRQYTDRPRKCPCGSTLRLGGDPEAGGGQLPDGDLSDGVHAGVRRARSKSVDELVNAVRWSGRAHLDASVGPVAYRPAQAEGGGRGARPPAKADALDPAREDEGPASLGSGRGAGAFVWAHGRSASRRCVRKAPRGCCVRAKGKRRTGMSHAGQRNGEAGAVFALTNTLQGGGRGNNADV